MRPWITMAAVVATDSAECTNCSASTTVIPSLARVRTTSYSSAHDQRRKAHRDLVQQQQPGLAHEHARQSEHLLLSTGQGPRQLLTPLGEDREARERF